MMNNFMEKMTLANTTEEEIKERILMCILGTDVTELTESAKFFSKVAHLVDFITETVTEGDRDTAYRLVGESLIDVFDLTLAHHDKGDEEKAEDLKESAQEVVEDAMKKYSHFVPGKGVVLDLSEASDLEKAAVHSALETLGYTTDENGKSHLN